MAEMNLYISDVLRNEMNLCPNVDWEILIHRVFWDKIEAMRSGREGQK
ncbi:MAG: hypothetical protein WCI04_06245 [archaeon]